LGCSHTLQQRVSEAYYISGNVPPISKLPPPIKLLDLIYWSKSKRIEDRQGVVHKGQIKGVILDSYIDSFKIGNYVLSLRVEEMLQIEYTRYPFPLFYVSQVFTKKKPFEQLIHKMKTNYFSGNSKAVPFTPS
jgi:hypothetical protein